MRPRTRLDDEVLELLAGEPELRAIADAYAETQLRRRRVRPVGVAVGAVLLAAATIAIVLWSGSSSSGISGNVAYAAMGGEARVLRLNAASVAPGLVLTYDRQEQQLTVAQHGRRVRVPAADLPPQAATLAPALRPFGAGIELVVSLLTEYPERAKAGKLEAVRHPPRGFEALRWVGYRSSLGYVVDVGLRRSPMLPVEVVREGAPSPLRVDDVVSSN